MQAEDQTDQPPVAEIVAEGEAEIGMQQIVAIRPVKGAELVGPLPGEFRTSSSTRRVFAPVRGQSGTARGSLPFMATPDAVRMIRTKGMEPG